MSVRELTPDEQAEVDSVMSPINDMASLSREAVTAKVYGVQDAIAALVRRLGDAEREMAVTHKTNVVPQEMTNDYLARMKHALNPFPWEAE